MSSMIKRLLQFRKRRREWKAQRMAVLAECESMRADWRALQEANSNPNYSGKYVAIYKTEIIAVSSDLQILLHDLVVAYGVDVMCGCLIEKILTPEERQIPQVFAASS